MDQLEKQLQEARLSHKQEVERLHKDLQEGRAAARLIAMTTGIPQCVVFSLQCKQSMR